MTFPSMKISQQFLTFRATVGVESKNGAKQTFVALSFEGFSPKDTSFMVIHIHEDP